MLLKVKLKRFDCRSSIYMFILSVMVFNIFTVNVHKLDLNKKKMFSGL